MDCRPLDLVAELTDAVLFCEARIKREGLILSYAEPEEMIPVYADPDRLRQVFINILDNAIKYSAPGGRIIGLALVDSIMTALDGTLDIKSTLGRGTVVTLGLPLYHKS